MSNFATADVHHGLVDARMEYRALRAMEAYHWESINVLWKSRQADNDAMNLIVKQQKKINNMLGKLQGSLTKSSTSVKDETDAIQLVQTNSASAQATHQAQETVANIVDCVESM